MTKVADIYLKNPNFNWKKYWNAEIIYSKHTKNNLLSNISKNFVTHLAAIGTNSNLFKSLGTNPERTSDSIISNFKYQNILRAIKSSITSFRYPSVVITFENQSLYSAITVNSREACKFIRRIYTTRSCIRTAIFKRERCASPLLLTTRLDAQCSYEDR